MSFLFVLGSERSGSTWLASVIDAHPDVELFMEPCADYAGLFPGLPAREVPLPSPTPEQVAAFRDGLGALGSHKHALLFRPGRPAPLRAVDRKLVRLLRSGSARLGLETPLFASRHELLNLHGASLPARLLTRKAAKPTLRVVKELRLNLKLPLVAAAVPDARVVAILRHPTVQIASILRRFEADGLGELASALVRAFPGIAAHPRLATFRTRSEAVDPRTDTVGALALWWIVNHQVLLEDLDACGLPFRLISHEALCDAPEREAAKLLRFAELPSCEEVDEFLRWSTAADGDLGDPLDTRRESGRVPAAALAAVPPGLRAAIEEALLAAAAGDALAAPLAALLEPLGAAGAGNPHSAEGIRAHR